MTRVLSDQVARDRIRNDLATTLVVEAAAGTGKTTELVSRIVGVVTQGLSTLSRMVAVTFTEKAAGELKLRLRGRLETELRETSDPEVLRHLENAIAELEVAHIGTIHSLCADILRERPIEAGLDPLFEVAADDQMERLYETAFDQWFQRVLTDPPEGVRRVLRLPTRAGDGPRQTLMAAGWSMVQHRDHAAPWRRDPWDRDAAIRSVLDAMQQLGALAPLGDKADDYLTRALIEIGQRATELSRIRDADLVENELRGLANDNRHRFWNWRGFRDKLFNREQGILKDDVLEHKQRVKAVVDAFAQASGHDLAALLHEELQGAVQRYEELKDQQGVVDFVDLLIRTRDLLVGDTEVRSDLQQRFTHLFVDEFQDTDPLQAEILVLLAAADPVTTAWRQVRPVPGKLFVVGDPKQSIYRFRRADVRLYESVKAQLAEAGAAVLHLETSFRSQPPIQQLVNHSFERMMVGAEDGSQARYVPLAPFREGGGEQQPCVVALPIPEAMGRNGVVKKQVEATCPRAVGAFVDWMLTDSGWTVEEDGEQVPLASRHICLLFRRFRTRWKDYTRPYVDFLESREVPHILIGGSAFHEREEVAALRNALLAIEWPDDELSVYATLRGPLFGHDDESLFRFRTQHGGLHPLHDFSDVADDTSVGQVATSLALLGHLHMGRNRDPIATTMVRLLDAVRAHAGLADWPNGEQTLANVLRLVHHAHAFEAQGATSFRLFVEELVRLHEKGGASDAPIVEEGTEGVRIMTVHKAKGLEFPVVILCDPTSNLQSTRPGHFVDSDRGLWLERLAGCAPVELDERAGEATTQETHENVRLTYVAATRARDLLVIPVVNGAPIEDSWLSPLQPGALPGVVTWNLEHLDLSDVPRPGLRQVDFLQKQKTIDDGAAEYRAWRQAREETRRRAKQPSIQASSVTELVAERGFAGPSPVDKLEVEQRDLTRPSGTRFGTLVHAVLAEVPLDASGAVVGSHTAVQARILGAPADETEAAASAVRAALEHPIFEEARAALEVRREVPLVARLPDGVLAEGVVDLAYRTDDGWVVVDYKTDIDPAARAVEYERQVALYIHALKKAVGQPVRGVLLTV